MKSKTDPTHPMMVIKKSMAKKDLFREVKNELLEIVTDPKLAKHQVWNAECALSYITLNRPLGSFQTDEMVKKAFHRACLKVSDQTWKDEFHDWCFAYLEDMTLVPDGRTTR